MSSFGMRDTCAVTHKYYRYGFLLRPPGPGCQPRDGLVSTKCIDGIHILYNHRLWGWAVYDRMLTEEEVFHYDLEFLDTWTFNGPIHDLFEEGHNAGKEDS